MIESLVITLLPVAFLTVLFGGGALFRRRNVDMDGRAPINKLRFVSSKYAIVLLWAAMVVQAWGVHLSFVDSPPVLRWIALGAWIIGFGLLFAGRFGLGSSFRIGTPKEETALRTDGLYCLSRNPMYVGVYATVLAVVLYTLNPLLLLAAVYIVVVHHQIVLAGEAGLRTTFGEEYVGYCQRVRRYL